MLGLVAPHDHGDGTTAPAPAGPTPPPRNMARAMPPSVWRTSGSSVRLPAKLGCLGHDSALLNAWPGGLPCPWNRGTVDTVAWHQAARGKRWSQRSRPCMKVAGLGPAQEPSWLVERLWLGIGHASTVRPDPSTLGVVGERGSHHEDCLQPVPGSAGQPLREDSPDGPDHR
jgi:hypothetical protein